MQHAARRPPSKARQAGGPKRFTVRDGFHLKDRNDERRCEIDHHILPPSGLTDRTPLAGSQAGGPSKDDVCSSTNNNEQPDKHQPIGVDTDIAVIFDFLQRAPPKLGSASSGNNDHGEAPDGPSRKLVSRGDGDATSREETVPPLALTSSHTQAEAVAILARLAPSSDWLIYRHRTNVTPRRREVQLERMLAEMLDPKGDDLLQPTKPTKPLASSGKRRSREHRSVAAKAPHHSLMQNGNIIALSHTTTTAVRESNAVSRSQTSTPQPYATQRSNMREKSAVPLKTDKLLSRLDELRTFPAVVNRVLELERERREEQVLLHGEDLVRKNRQQHRGNGTPLVPPLQRPPLTPLFPSIVEHKMHQAIKRKQLVDDQQEQALKSTVNRWQNRRLEIEQQERRHYRESQWILIVCLARSTSVWMRRFSEFKARRDALFRMAMIKKIQRYWRQQQLVRHNAMLALSMPAHSALRSQFYRIPAVLKSIHLVQQAMRGWLVRKRRRQNLMAAEIIITSWLEFQDVKFRRLILRFRKRVRDFQIMWRAWRAITDARIKLLLLVWARVEKKNKRRGGLTPGGNDSRANTPHNGGSTGAGSGGDSSPHRKMETMHRHLRNGGAVLTALSVLSTSPKHHGNAPSPYHSPSRNAKQDLELRIHMQEDLQHAMRDYYRTDALPSPARTQGGHHSSTSALLHGTKVAPPTSNSPHHQHYPLHGSVSPLNKHHGSSPGLPWTLANGNATQEKIPLQLKISLLRHLLSDKRKKFQANKDQKRAEWKERRQQMRRIDFRYNVLEELAAYQRFQAEHSVFLVLHSISEHEIHQLIHQAHQQLRVSTSPLQQHMLEIPDIGSLGSLTRETSRQSITPNSPPVSARHRSEAQRRSTMMLPI